MKQLKINNFYKLVPPLIQQQFYNGLNKKTYLVKMNDILFCYKVNQQFKKQYPIYYFINLTENVNIKIMFNLFVNENIDTYFKQLKKKE